MPGKIVGLREATDEALREQAESLRACRTCRGNGLLLMGDAWTTCCECRGAGWCRVCDDDADDAAAPARDGHKSMAELFFLPPWLVP